MCAPEAHRDFLTLQNFPASSIAWCGKSAPLNIEPSVRVITATTHLVGFVFRVGKILGVPVIIKEEHVCGNILTIAKHTLVV